MTLTFISYGTRYNDGAVVQDKHISTVPQQHILQLDIPFVLAISEHSVTFCLYSYACDRKLLCPHSA